MPSIQLCLFTSVSNRLLPEVWWRLSRLFGLLFTCQRVAQLRSNLLGEASVLVSTLLGDIPALCSNLQKYILTLCSDLQGEIPASRSNLHGEIPALCLKYTRHNKCIVF